MKTFLVLVASVIVVHSGLYAQVVPAATAGATNFSYFLRYSQTAQFAGSLGNWQSANASGEVEYFNGRIRSPFNLSYVGGYTWTLAGPSQYSNGFFQYLSVYQGTTVRNWRLSVGDNVSYRPQAPVTGLSGIPGTGEPIVVPPPPSESILTVGTHALNNLATGDMSRILAPRFEVNFGAANDLLFYPQGNGLDTNSISAHGGVTLRIDRRSSIIGEYVYSTFSYSGVNVRINSNLAEIGYDRAWTRRLHSHVDVGPEWITSTDSAAVPSNTLVSANAEVNYRLRTGSAFVSYNRGTGGGSGFLVGQFTESIAAGYSCLFGRLFSAEAIGGYRRISPLNNSSETIHSEFGAVQTSWLIGRHVSVFANYTFVSQGSDMSLPNNVISGPMNTVGFGITVTPRSSHRF